MTAKQTGQGKSISFEANIKRLDEIIETLESGNKPLDEVVTMYEEGIRLSKTCIEYLDQTELRIKKLVKDAGGKFEIRDDDDQ